MAKTNVPFEYTLRDEVLKLLGSDYQGKLTLEVMDIETCPEIQYYVRHDDCVVSIVYLITRSPRKVVIQVEYPSYQDGEVITYDCKNLPEACRVFAFAVSILRDLRAAIDEVI